MHVWRRFEASQREQQSALISTDGQTHAAQIEALKAARKHAALASCHARRSALARQHRQSVSRIAAGFGLRGDASAHTRVGPKRERLSREQWKQRKEQARRDAVLHRQMSVRVESLADAEAQFDVEADQKAVEVADKLARVEALYEEALSAKSDAVADARLILDRAEAESAATKQQALAKLDEKSRKLDRQSSDLQSACMAFEHEKRTIVRETVSRVAVCDCARATRRLGGQCAV